MSVDLERVGGVGVITLNARLLMLTTSKCCKSCSP